MKNWFKKIFSVYVSRWLSLITNWLQSHVMHILVIILVGMTGFLLAVGFDQTGGKVAQFLGTDKTMYPKKETIQLIAWGMSGMLAAIVATVINRRANAQDRNNELIEKGHINDRFQHAATNLGHVKRRVRITSFYQFYYLAKGSEYDFRKNIFDILCDHLRHITSGQFYDKKEEGKDAITDECQTLLNILFNPKGKPVFDEFHADLKNINLPHADLSNANIKKAKMHYANLSCAMFNNADLSGVDFTDANLSSANFHSACLVNAELSGAKLAGANFHNADLTGAYFVGAIISHSTSFSNANLANTNFLGVNLTPAYLLHVRSVEGADFRGANLLRDQLPTGRGKYIADRTIDEFGDVEKDLKS